MRRRLAAAAIVFGVVGVAPVLVRLADLLAILLGLYPPPFEDLGEPRWGATVNAVIFLAFLLGAPSLLLWGLIGIQRTERGRGRVIIWTSVLCACTAPFGVGLILGPPLFFCVFLPSLRRFKAAGVSTPFNHS
jgi:MFS family permease